MRQHFKKIISLTILSFVLIVSVFPLTAPLTASAQAVSTALSTQGVITSSIPSAPQSSTAQSTAPSSSEYQNCSSGGSNNWLGLPTFGCLWDDTVAYIFYFIMTISSWLLSLAGLIFDFVMNYTVVQMKSNLDGFSIINSGWSDIRDIGNLVFIFMAIYLGIQEIIGLNYGRTKLLIRNLIIVGLLVNFSLFFTQVLIDASNILTISFYNLVLHVLSPTNNSFTAVFMKPLGIMSIYNYSAAVSKLTPLGPGTIAIVGIGASAFFIMTAITFFTVAILFISRFILFIFLMILSPIAFLFAVLPGKLQEISKQWWQTLSGQLIFAPLYMILILLVALLVNHSGLNINNLAGALLTPTAQNTSGIQHVTATNANSDGLIGQIFFFILIIALMNVALMLAVKYASQGTSIAGAALGMVGRGTASVTGRAGRSIFGGTAANLLNEKGVVGNKLRNLKGSDSGIVRGLAGLTTTGLKKTSEASFDVRNTGIIKKLNEKTSISFGKARGEGGRAKEIERGAEELQKQYESAGGASRETLVRLKEADTNRKQATKQLAIADRNAKSLKQEEARVRANAEAIASPNDKKKVGDEAVKKFRETEHVQNILRARNDALTKYRESEKIRKNAEKALKEEQNARSLDFAIKQNVRAHRFGGLNLTSLMGGKPRAAYDQALENMVTHKKTKKGDKEGKIDENKERAEGISIDLQSAIDAGAAGTERIEEIINNTPFTILKHIEPDLFNNRTVIKTLAATKKGQQFLKSNASSPKQYKMIEDVINETH